MFLGKKLIIDISHFWPFIITTLILFIIIAGRYFLVAGIFYSIFYVWHPLKWQQRKISKGSYKKDQFSKEMIWSLITGSIFSITGSLGLLAWQKGYLHVYLSFNNYPIWWIPISLLILFFLHETYYYWIHRWMHIPSVFRIVHQVHHQSKIASPWTAFAFHPLEALLQALFLPFVLLFLPVHVYVLLLLLVIMTISSVINHLDIEVYPEGFEHKFPWKWIIGATHHAQHHKQYRYNFGLYFTFWDKWSGTEHTNGGIHRN